MSLNALRIKMTIFLAYTLVFAYLGKWEWLLAAIFIQLLFNLFWVLYMVKDDHLEKIPPASIDHSSTINVAPEIDCYQQTVQENKHWSDASIKLAILCLVLYFTLGYLSVPFIIMIVLSSYKTKLPILHIVFKIIMIIAIIFTVFCFAALAWCFMS